MDRLRVELIVERAESIFEENIWKQTVNGGACGASLRPTSVNDEVHPCATV